jgi:hypothetical protein
VVTYIPICAAVDAIGFIYVDLYIYICVLLLWSNFICIYLFFYLKMHCRGGSINSRPYKCYLLGVVLSPAALTMHLYGRLKTPATLINVFVRAAREPSLQINDL